MEAPRVEELIEGSYESQVAGVMRPGLRGRWVASAWARVAVAASFFSRLPRVCTNGVVAGHDAVSVVAVLP